MRTIVGGFTYFAYSNNKSNLVAPAQNATTAPTTAPQRRTLSVCITGAAGKISYNLIPQLLSGEVFGKDVDIDLRLLDVPSSEWELKSLQMEMEDCAFYHLKNISYGSKPEILFKDADLVIFLGGLPRRPGMERKDLLQINGDIFVDQGRALDVYAKQNVKSLVVANPSITNTMILSDYAPTISKKNFTSLSRLDQNRAVAQLSLQTGVDTADIKNVVAWGNHSNTMYIDTAHGTILGRKIKDFINNDDYLDKEFYTRVQQRGNDILIAKNSSTVMSGAVSIRDHLKDWFLGTQEGEFTSMGVYMDGSAYNIPAGIFYSMPVTCKNFDYEIVQNLTIDEISREQIDSSKRDILSEKKEFYENHVKK